jgi:2'-5' RNA ligase
VHTFVAVWPDEATVTRLSMLDIGQARDLRIVRPEHWHVTLRFLGDVAEVLLPTIGSALRETAGHLHGPIRCEVGPATTWFSRGSVLMVPVAGLDELAQAVQIATSNVVPPARSGASSFHGHITLARARPRLDETARQSVAGIRLTATFGVDSFDLVSSELSDEGPTYTTLERVALPRDR